MIQSKTTTIGDRQFFLRQLPATKGRAVMLRIAKPIAACVKVSAEGELTGIDLEAAVVALTENDLAFISDAFAGATVVDVVDETAGKTHQKKLALVFDDVFAGPEGYRAMLLWLVESITWNFGSFTDVFGELKTMVGAKTTTSSPSTSTGSSEGSSPPSA